MTRWGARDVGDQSGRRILITGGNSGVGLEAARVLAEHNGAVVIACRDLRKGERAAADIRARSGEADVELLQLDLADLAAVEAAAEEYGERFGTLDVLVNNAGVMAVPYRATVDGFELQFGTNHLGHFALTGHLLPCLLAATAPRVVTVSSGAHRAGTIDFANLDAAKGYSKWAAYCSSKLANLLFMFELQRRAVGAGIDLLSVGAHPGYANTNLQTNGPAMAGKPLLERAWSVFNAVAGQSAARGSLPTVYAAVSPGVAGGDYIGPSGPAELWGSPVKVRPTRAARDPALAARLWSVSQELTGVGYEVLDR
jgi:NAD(P)-dependent dehydrogenase (short-subunit alcohol dehydrogenase family)